jgi:DNA-binding FrmR family transcriptional regulator
MNATRRHASLSTLRGYGISRVPRAYGACDLMLTENETKRILARLKRIGGQVSGIQRMLEKDAYCVDIINQITAAQAALDQVGKLILAQHVKTCIQDAFKSGTEAERRQKTEELLDVISKM